MKKKPAKKFISYFKNAAVGASLIAFTTACGSRSENLYEQAYSEIEKGHYRIAADLLEKSSQLETDNTKKYKNLLEVARIVRFEIQDYERAIKVFREIILSSDDETQRILAQESIAEIYLENIQDYNSALKELQVLEPLLTDTKKKEKTRLRIAQALFLTGKNDQALDEIQSAEKYIKFTGTNFLKLKAEILLAQKKYKEAISAYDELKTKDPTFFADENLFIATSIVYEENEQYTEALNYLTKNQALIKDKPYYELRIKRLKERIANKPLSRGAHK
ncbi:MAG: tetratricopeptide repeat protein [Pseudobdellovibrio sp.]